MKRNDSWTPENDELLAETVLEYVRNGLTQLQAFEKAAERIGRTSKACGFRWNSEVRKRYESELAAAKEARKTAPTPTAAKTPEIVAIPSKDDEYDVTFESPSDNNIVAQIDPEKLLVDLREYIARLQKENERLLYENESLRKNNGDDVSTLISILNRARQSGKLNELIAEYKGIG